MTSPIKNDSHVLLFFAFAMALIYYAATNADPYLITICYVLGYAFSALVYQWQMNKVYVSSDRVNDLTQATPNQKIVLSMTNVLALFWGVHALYYGARVLFSQSSRYEIGDVATFFIAIIMLLLLGTLFVMRMRSMNTVYKGKLTSLIKILGIFLVLYAIAFFLFVTNTTPFILRGSNATVVFVGQIFLTAYAVNTVVLHRMEQQVFASTNPPA